MNYKLDRQLEDQFPFMKDIICECDDGWFGIIQGLCQDLVKAYESCGKDPNNIVVVQVKEKFGELRFYTDILIPGADQIITAAEEESRETCEVCGAPGTQELYRGWIQTVCNEHKRRKDV